MRRLTSAAVLGMCGFVAASGWSVAQFAVARGDLGGRPAAELIRGWAEVPGLAGDALAASLTRMRDAADVEGARRRAADLGLLLAARPLSSDGWLSLAAMRATTAQPSGEVLDALTMSWLTGPNEGPIMMRRGLFAVMLWETLPAAARKRAADDISGAVLAQAAGETDMAAAGRVLAAKSPATRQEIANLLAADGLPAAALSQLGL